MASFVSGFLFALWLLFGCQETIGKHDSCGKPAEIKNAFHTGTGRVFMHNTQISYECQVGFQKTGIYQAVCLDGVWQGPMMSCKPLCGRPPKVSLAQPVGPSENSKYFEQNIKIDYECDFGYEISGINSAVCNEQGIWDGPWMFCKKEHGACRIQEVENGMVQSLDGDSQFSVKHNDEVSVRCNEGYQLVGGKRPRCSDGRWNPEEFPVCVAKSCDGNDVEVTHGSFLPGIFENGEMGTVICDENYSLREVNATCSFGKWSRTYFRCHLVETLLCERPSGVLDALYNESLSKMFFDEGDVLTYRCKDDYIQRGTVSYVCRMGIWIKTKVHDTLRCERKQVRGDDCSRLPVVQNSVHNGSLLEIYSHGLVIEFSCMYGYTGQKSRFECFNGDWISLGKPLKCVRSRCSEEYVRHGSFRRKLQFSFGDVLTYSCKAHYEIVGNASLKCMGHGQWNLDIPKCERTCSGRPKIDKNVEPIDNLDIEKLYYSRDTVLKYGCKYDDRPHGFPYAICRNGKWIGPFIECKEPCRESSPARVTNARIVENDQFRTKLTYECLNGYTAVGINEAWCVKQQWHGPSLTCKRVCKLSPKADYYFTDSEEKVIGDEIVEGQSVVAVCKKRYILKDNEYAFCSKKGWSPRAPKCVGECKEFPDSADSKYLLVKDGNSKQGKFGHGAELKLKCSGGYKPFPKEKNVCNAGTWKHTTFKCIKRKTPLQKRTFR